jgi:Glu-tRNA(Gln) amidotransferase subunit E-like FAD-binding protein
MFKRVGSGEMMKEAVSEVFAWLSGNEGKSVQEAIESLGLKTVPEGDLDALVEKAMADNAKLIQERGEGSFGVLMGIVMKSFRGKIDSSQVSKVLKKKMNEKMK